MKKILILPANPQDTNILRLDQEVREIEEGLRRASLRSQFKLEQKWAVRQRDFYRAILDYQPEIVHFSGHGAGVDGIVLENEADEPAFVNADALASMFKLFATKGVECVLLNACYSEVQAKAISQHVNYVIGMNRTIGDKAAIKFAVGFYDALGADRPYEEAYEFGCNAIDLEGMVESSIPVIKSRKNEFNARQQEPALVIKTNVDINEIISQRLNARGYVIQHVLGIGGFGITYLTYDKINKQNLVVIKTVKSELLQYIRSNLKKLEEFNKSIDSFRNEARALLVCKHPNIVHFHSIFSESFELQIGKYFTNQSEISTYKLELLFLVMEYIEGENLEELVSRRSSPLPETEALRYIQQIGEALVVIHNNGLLHRDIKPQNIMVRKATNDAVLIDFGIARDFLPEITESITVSFTPRYTPPEQRRRRGKRGNYTDIYGLAATLYYLLTAQPPTDAYERQLGDSLIEPQEINPNISDKVNRAILWGMELDRSNRPQTVQEWFIELLSSKSKDIYIHKSDNDNDSVKINLDIFKQGFFTTIQYNPKMDIGDFLDTIWFQLHDNRYRLPAYRYSEVWALKDPKNGKLLLNLGRDSKSGQGTLDKYKSINDVGIKPSMELIVVLIDHEVIVD